jgi:hypothetical protein
VVAVLVAAGGAPTAPRRVVEVSSVLLAREVLESIVMSVETGSAVSLICGILSLSDVVGDMAFFGGEGGVCDSQSTLGKAMVANDDDEGVDVVDIGAGVRVVSCLNKSSFMEADRFVRFMIY